MTELQHCASYSEDLSALLDGELSPEREAEVRAHASDCERCRAQLEAFGSVDRALQGAPVPPLSGDLRARLQQRIDADDADPAPVIDLSARRRRRARAVGAGLAVAASLAVYVAVTNRAPTPAPTETPEVLAMDLEAFSDEELAVVMEYDTIRDLEVIANLELLEQLAASGEIAELGGGSS